MEKIAEVLQTLKEYRIDIFNHSIFEKQLTSKQFKIFLVLISEPEKIFTRKELLEKVWDKKNGNSVTLRTIDVHIRRIREAFGYDYINNTVIETIHTTGYRLDQRFLRQLQKIEKRMNLTESRINHEVENRVTCGEFAGII